MPRIREHIDIEASSTDVFRFCHDPDHRPEWDERISRIKMITRAPIRRGTLVRVDARRGRGPVFSWEGEYVEFHYPSSSVIRVMDAARTSYFKLGREEWQFGRSGAVTRFTLTWEYELRGFLGRILDRLWRRSSIRRAIKRSLANLKKMLEADS